MLMLVFNRTYYRFIVFCRYKTFPPIFLPIALALSLLKFQFTLLLNFHHIFHFLPNPSILLRHQNSFPTHSKMTFMFNYRPQNTTEGLRQLHLSLIFLLIPTISTISSSTVLEPLLFGLGGLSGLSGPDCLLFFFLSFHSET